MLPVTYGGVDGVSAGDGVPVLVVYCAVDEDGRGEGDEGEKKGGASEDRRHCSELDGEHRLLFKIIQSGHRHLEGS